MGTAIFVVGVTLSTAFVAAIVGYTIYRKIWPGLLDELVEAEAASAPPQ
jgi:hypothetical protein